MGGRPSALHSFASQLREGVSDGGKIGNKSPTKTGEPQETANL